MSTLVQRLAAARVRRDAASTETLAARVRRVVAAWRHRARSRDIGLTPADAARECAKPFWLG